MTPIGNAHERLIGSIRRECLDHVMELYEAHLKRILTTYFEYYHNSRTHLSLDRMSAACIIATLARLDGASGGAALCSAALAEWRCPAPRANNRLNS